MKLSKAIATACAAIMMTLAFAGLTGCNANAANEELIRSSISEEFDAYKNHDSSVVNQIRSQNAVDLATLGLDGEEYANAVLDGFDYSIEDVTVDGKEATVTLVLTQKELDEDEAAAIVTQLSEDPEIAHMSTSEIKQAISDKLMEYINSVPAVTQEPVTLHLELNGKIWDLTSESATRVQSLFTF